MDYVQAGAIAIHTLAMILVVGYYGILGRVILLARLLGRLGLATEATTGVGAFVVLLTAIAQVR